MKKIKTKEEANHYYKLINDHIEEYLKMGVKPRNIKRYFSNNSKLKSFLIRVGLDDVEGIEMIVRDILEDIDAMSRDKVMTFESFLIRESVERIEYERILADVFHTSLSHIEADSENTNLFKIDDLDKKWQVLIYSQSDFEDFKTKLKSALIDNAKSSELEMYQINFENSELKTKLNIQLFDLLDENKLEKKIDSLLDKDKVFQIMTNWINNVDTIHPNKVYQFFKEVNGYMIWLQKARPKVIKKIQ